jgi:hypothetical protein
MKKSRPICVVPYDAHGYQVVIEIFGSQKKGYWGSWRCPDLLNCIGEGKVGATIEDAVLYSRANAFGGVGGHPHFIHKS